MARTTLSYTSLVGNNATAATPTNVDVANGMTIAQANTEHTILVVSNTDASARNLTISQGDPVGGSGQYPALVVSVPATATRYVGPFESARYKQRDGSLSLDFAAGFTGTVTALLTPRGI